MSEELSKPIVFKPHPVLEGLPVYLKDPKNYKKIRKALLEVLSSTHSHGEVLEWAECFDCQNRMRAHADMIRKLGFKSTAQYRAWLKIHEEIKRRDVLPKYNSPKP